MCNYIRASPYAIVASGLITCWNTGTAVVHFCLLYGLLECKKMKWDASLLAGKEYFVGRRCARRWTALESSDTSPWTGFHTAISYHRLAANTVCCRWWRCWVNQLLLVLFCYHCLGKSVTSFVIFSSVCWVNQITLVLCLYQFVG